MAAPRVARLADRPRHWWPPPPAALVEFKFPREPSEKNAPWTMVLGEVLKDFYRLASCPGDPDRLFVFVESSRLRTYLAGAAERYGLRLDADRVELRLDADRVELRPAAAAQLPTTAAQIVGTDLAACQVTAQRMHMLDIDDALRLSVYLVDGLDAPPGPTPAAVVSESPIPEPPVLTTVTGARAGAAAESASAAGVAGGARHQILDAIRGILARSPDDTFTPLQVVDEMKRRESRYAEPTVRTMVTAHMCANAPNNAATTHDDLERVGQGVYRLVGTTGSTAHQPPPGTDSA